MYANPQNAGDKLGLIYGDFYSTATRNPLEPGGCLKATLIDKLQWIYHLNDVTSASPVIEVYSRQNTAFGTLVPANLYTVNNGGDIENTGVNILSIQFDQAGPNPTEYELTWRGYGATAYGNFDPFSAIRDAFIHRGNWLESDFDPATVAQAPGIAAAYAIPVHWVFQEDQTYGQILTELWENYLADVYLTDQGQLAVRYNLWPMVPIFHNDIVQPYLLASRDCVGDDPEDSVTYHLDRENLINEVIVRWRHNWARNDQASETTFAHRPSQEAYHVRRPRNFTLKGIRTQAHLNAWIALFLSPLVEYPATVEIPLKSLEHLHIQRGAFIAMDWSAGPDVLGRGWDKRVLRVMETQTDYLEQTHTLTALDTRLSVQPPQAAPFRAQNNSLWYLRLRSEDGALEFVSSLEFPWVSAGVERHWVRRVTPNQQVIWVHPSNTGAITSAIAQPGVGTGDALAVNLRDWSFRGWDLDVGNGPGFAVTPRLRDLGVTLIEVPSLSFEVS